LWAHRARNGLRARRYAMAVVVGRSTRSLYVTEREQMCLVMQRRSFRQLAVNRSTSSAVGGCAHRRSSGASAGWGVVVAPIGAAAEHRGSRWCGSARGVAVASEVRASGLRLAAVRAAWLAVRPTYNNSLERTVKHRPACCGERRSLTSRSLWSAAQLKR